ncbi:MAG: nucleoside-triphosphatase [Candidatus Bipolaricaulota bacterium]
MADHIFRLLLANLDRRVKPPLFITGRVGAGKTEFCRGIVARTKEAGLNPGGIVSPRIVRDGETIGYRVVDVRTGEQKTFARLTPPGISVGKYYIPPGVLEWTKEVISDSLDGTDVVFLDEVGRLELRGKGLDSAVRSALESRTQLVLLVRSEFLSAVKDDYGIEEFHLHRVG